MAMEIISIFTLIFPPEFVALVAISLNFHIHIMCLCACIQHYNAEKSSTRVPEGLVSQYIVLIGHHSRFLNTEENLFEEESQGLPQYKL